MLLIVLLSGLAGILQHLRDDARVSIKSQSGFACFYSDCGLWIFQFPGEFRDVDQMVAKW